MHQRKSQQALQHDGGSQPMRSLVALCVSKSPTQRARRFSVPSVFYLFSSRRAQKHHRVTTLRDLVLQTLAAFVVLICPCSFAGAAQEAVWRIGKFDQSSAEFHQGEMKAPVVAGAQRESEVLYIVGKSSPATDWPAFQPGSSNGRAGFRPHPYTIQFDLPGAPRGLYTLKVALLVETPRVSRLQVEINGHRALLFQHPALDYAGGDVSSVFLPAIPPTPSRPTAHKFPDGGNQRACLDGGGRAGGARRRHQLRALSTTPWNSIKTRRRKFSSAELTVQALPTDFLPAERREAGRSWWTSISATTLPQKVGKCVLTRGQREIHREARLRLGFRRANGGVRGSGICRRIPRAKLPSAWAGTRDAFRWRWTRPRSGTSSSCRTLTWMWVTPITRPRWRKLKAARSTKRFR